MTNKIKWSVDADGFPDGDMASLVAALSGGRRPKMANAPCAYSRWNARNLQLTDHRRGPMLAR
jgi:hypothetical protein